jgi:IS5 family transposase
MQRWGWFCRIGIADKGFKKSALNKNIKAISAETWEAIDTELIGYGKKAVAAINTMPAADVRIVAISMQIDHYVQLAEKVIDQTVRRVMRGEKVDAADKVVSIFEPHTDIIVKDRRDTHLGHKICLTGGASNLILDCLVLEGNPADTDLAIPMLARQKQLYGRYPLKASFDGGFASKNNLKQAKSLPVTDVCFAKKRGIKDTDMCRSQYVYRSLRRFRAGIESGISWLKRCLGLTRCTWKGWHSFKAYVWSSVVAANRLTIARTRPATG